ncbi:MAG: triose-phosphate isomerase [Gammaproteobacteria bacterium]|nr:triose-phosphate isomerase [Gammaproteobacteria bacterium]
MTKRIPLVAGNWKLNGSRASIQALLAGIKTGLQNNAAAGELVVCPPFVYLNEIAQQLQGSNIIVGAQDVSEQAEGAFTGEVAAAMLAEVGCRYVIIGHSERRHVYGESDQLTAQKFVATQHAKLIPILCVGETLAEREQGITEKVIAQQLDAALQVSTIKAFVNAVIAYEPVWAIGTGKTASPEQAQAVHAFIRQRLTQHDAVIAAAVRIIYGGSVKANNAKEIFSQPDIDGGLIGGASLQAKDFLDIYYAAG